MDSQATPSAAPAKATLYSAELRPRSPALLALTGHARIRDRMRAVACELARILVTRTMLEMSVLVANENKNHGLGQ